MQDLFCITKYDNYSDDEPVGIAVIEKDKLPGPIDSSLWDYIPQTLFHRLVSIGEAYKLHFAQITDHVVDTILDENQCSSFEVELAFIRKTINDSALDSVIIKLLSKIQNVKNKNVLVISPP